jgi:alkylation response protein AidB-like acyl-CoA dehydrogenase
VEIRSRYRALDDAASRARGDELLSWLRDYAEHRVNSRLIDERRCVPPYIALDFGNHGLFGIQVESAFGGLGLRNRDVARVLEQLAAIDLGLGTFLLTSIFPGVRPIAAFSEGALRAEFLPQLASGRMLAGYAQTEPGAGTHFQAMQARAVRDGRGGFRVSGEKVWIGNATWAGILTTMARDVDPDGRGHGLTAFAIPTDRPGVGLGAELLSLGMRGMVQSEVSFREVALGPDFVLGEPGKALDVAVDSMSWSRFAIAATCIGAMKRCAQLMHRFASRRPIATGPLDEHPLVRIAITETLARAAATEELVHWVAAEIDEGRAVRAEMFAVCKVVGAEFLGQSADRLVQVLGSRGYDEENLAAQLLRDARVTRIFEGTSEALLAFIGAQAIHPRSYLPQLLRDAFDAADHAAVLEDAVDAIRRRSWPPIEAAGDPDADAPPRPWQSDRTGRAACWAFASAALSARAARTGDVLDAQAAAWARLHLADARDACAEPAREEQLLLDPVTVGKAVEALARSVGDVEQQLPGERRGLDPLLRRSEPSSNG